MPDTVQMPLPPVDGRTRRERVRRKVRAELLNTQGDDVTPQREILVNIAAEAEALRRAAFAVADVGEWAQAAAQGQRALDKLGLDRIAKDADTLEAIITELREPSRGT